MTELIAKISNINGYEIMNCNFGLELYNFLNKHSQKYSILLNTQSNPDKMEIS